MEKWQGVRRPDPIHLNGQAGRAFSAWGALIGDYLGVLDHAALRAWTTEHTDAAQIAFTADTNATLESNPDNVTSWLSEPSPVTAAVHDVYLHALQRWLDGIAIDHAGQQ